MSTLNLTPLHELHLAMAAKMTEFAGYAMPLHYPGGIIHEHLHCRSLAGLFDISHMGQCRLIGPQAAECLERLTPGGLLDLAVGQQKYSVLTRDDGGVIDDLIVTRQADGLHLIVNAACKAKDFAYLQQQLAASCSFEDCSERALLALQGPAAAAVMQRLCPAAQTLTFMQAASVSIAGIDCWLSRSGYSGEDGFEISTPAQHAEALARLLLAEPEVAAIGLGARDTLRLEAGLCLYGHELSETISPIEAGLGWLFKNQHHDFPGAERLWAEKRLGPARRRVGLKVVGKLPVRAGCLLSDAQQQVVGVVTSGSFSPSLQQPIAMALIDAQLVGTDAPLWAAVRTQRVQVKQTPLPFVAHRYAR